MTLGVKKDFFEVLARSVSYETVPDWLWPCNPIHMPVCQLAQHLSKGAIIHAVQNMNTLKVLFSFCDTLFSFYFVFGCGVGTDFALKN